MHLVPILRLSSAVAPPIVQIPVPPPSLVATVASSTSLALTFSYTPPPGFGSFIAQIAAGSGAFEPLVTQSEDTYTAPGLTAGVQYSLRLAVQTNETPPRTSVWSETVTIKIPSGSIKVNPVQGVASYNINGYGTVGDSPNLTEMQTYVKPNANVEIYAANYTLDALLPGAVNEPDFTPVDNDFMNLQATRPGARFSIILASRSFGDGYNGSSSQTIPSYGSGIPNAILSGSSSTYGIGTNGVQSGYTLAGYGTTYDEVALAIWRPNCNQVRINTAVALANHIVPDGSGLTYNEHPLVEDFIDGDETALGLPTVPGDYTWAAHMAAMEAYWAALAEAWTQTNVVPSMNWPGNNGSSNANDLITLVNSACNSRCCFSAPDVYSALDTDAEYAFLGYDYNGSSWVAGAGPYGSFANKMLSIAQIQEPDYARGTPSQIFSIIQERVSAKTYWTLAAGAPGFTWSAVLSVINANPTLNTVCPANYDDMCLAGGEL